MWELCLGSSSPYDYLRTNLPVLFPRPCEHPALLLPSNRSAFAFVRSLRPLGGVDCDALFLNEIHDDFVPCTDAIPVAPRNVYKLLVMKENRCRRSEFEGPTFLWLEMRIQTRRTFRGSQFRWTAVARILPSLMGPGRLPRIFDIKSQLKSLPQIASR